MSPDLIAALELLAAEGREALVGGFLVFARVGAFFALLPAFGEQVVPVRVRLVAALATCLVVAPVVLEQIVAPETGPVPLARFVVIETGIGLALGAGLRLMVQALQIAGSMAAQATSLAQFFGGAGVDPQPAISQFLVMAGLAALVMSGFAERMVGFLVLGYDLLPAGQIPDLAALAGWGVERTGQAFALAFVLAAPFVIGSAIYNLALGAINRAMPQLMVAFIGAPALTLGGLALLMLAAPVMILVWHEAFMAFLADPTAPGRAR